MRRHGKPETSQTKAKAPLEEARRPVELVRITSPLEDKVSLKEALDTVRVNTGRETFDTSRTTNPHGSGTGHLGPLL